MRDAYLTLAVAEGFGEAPVPALLEPGLDPRAVLASPPEPPAVPPRIARRLRDPDLRRRAAAIDRHRRDLGLHWLTPACDGWPERLDAQPLRPLALFVRGDPEAMRRQPAAGIVGSRSPTPYGTDAAEQLCRTLASAGIVLWSGLARGIDSIAHRAAVRHHQPTVGVLAGGLDAIYPPEHRTLADEIVARGGCLCSELPPGTRARRGHFVRRNRLLAAGPTVVAVVEASLTSGALHTARFAAECSTDVFAVPGPWRSERSQGCHRLIAEGGGILEAPETLLHALGVLQHGGTAAARQLTASADENAVLRLLAAGPRPTDLLRRESGLDDATFARVLFALQRSGCIAPLPGDLWRTSGSVGRTVGTSAPPASARRSATPTGPEASTPCLGASTRWQ